MGMAASQARFLSLTARRTNCEYMGQQINQARTALANESAGLFEKLLALQPPTPPSSLDEKYFTQGYSFIDPTDEMRKRIHWESMETADEPVSSQEFTFTVHTQEPEMVDVLDPVTGLPTYTAQLDANGAIILEPLFDADGITPTMDFLYDGPYEQVPKLDADGNQVYEDDGVTPIIYWKGTGNIVQQQATNDDGSLKYTQRLDAGGNPMYEADGVTPIMDPVMEPVYTQLNKVLQEKVQEEVMRDIYTPHVSTLDFSTGDFVDIPIESISGLTPPTNEEVSRTEVRYATIEHTIYDVDGNLTKLKETAPMVMYFDNRERLLGFQELTLNAELIDDPEDPNYYYAGDATTGAMKGNPAVATSDPPGIENFYLSAVADKPLVYQCKELTYNGEFDECRYQEDMDKYEFDKAAYDYQIEQINLKTKAIQQQDKSLELKLKQLDTDRNAINTEMEAVSKVITKNIETTFKTFA